MARPEPTAGTFEGGVFAFPVRVYYEDTDAAGIVYYANYLKFAERARSEMLRAFGTDNARLVAETGLVFVVRRCIADFRQPARLDDHLEVQTRVTGIAGASFAVDHRIMRAGRELVALDVRLACLNAARRPARLPEGLRAALRDLEHATER